MTPRAATPLQAEQILRDYRADHRIVPVGPAGFEVCGWDDIPLDRIKGGWVHKVSEIRNLAEQAPIRFPSEVM